MFKIDIKYKFELFLSKLILNFMLSIPRCKNSNHEYKISFISEVVIQFYK